MTNNVITKRIFSDDEIKGLQSLIDTMGGTPDSQWLNITNIFKTNLEDFDDFVNHFVSKLIKYSSEMTGKSMKMHRCFFLEYHPGGEAKMHFDSHARYSNGVSIITLINQVDLIGGTIIIDDGTGKLVEIPQKVGETVFYNADVTHGVSKVTQGYRQVLVTWLVSKE